MCVSLIVETVKFVKFCSQKAFGHFMLPKTLLCFYAISARLALQ